MTSGGELFVIADMKHRRRQHCFCLTFTGQIVTIKITISLGCYEEDKTRFSSYKV